MPNNRARIDRKLDDGSLDALTWDWLKEEYGPSLSELVVKTMTRLYSHRALSANGEPSEVARQNGWAYFFSLIGDASPTHSLLPVESNLIVEEPVQNGHSELDEQDSMDLNFELTGDFGD